MADTAIDIITRQVTETLTRTFEGALAQLNAEAEDAKARADAFLADLEAEGRRRMDELFAAIPAAPVITQDGDFDPIGWIKAQAGSRALRTLLQGLVGVVLMAAGNAFVQSLQSDTFDLLSWDDWKVALTASSLAVITAGVSYVQNKLGIKPPKVQ